MTKTQDSLEGAAVAASSDEGEQQEADLDQPQIKLTFENTSSWLDEAPKLGEGVKFEVHGYVRRTGKEWTEKEKVREFVVVKVTDIERVD